MSKARKIDPQKTIKAIRDVLLQGPSSAKLVCEKLGISQSAFSRLISNLNQDLLITGKAKGAMYALKRKIPTLGSQFDLYQIDHQGNTHAFGRLFAVQPKGFYFKSNKQSGFYDDLPYFLNDHRPSGFLGRTVPSQHPDLNFPSDITKWSADMTLEYIAQHGTDLIGNFVVGDPALQAYTRRFKKLKHDIDHKDRLKAYEKMASDVLKLGDPGSSAGGEQPKFLTTLGPTLKQVLVKFSPPLSESIGQRRGDLLVCEHIAHQLIKKTRKPSLDSEILKGKNRIFLETKRFDRIPPKGRVSVISAESLLLEYGDLTKNWVDAFSELQKKDLISMNTFNEIRFFHLFGELIANTDMHSGNLSFFLDGLKVKSIAPIYDMLPMHYAPQNEQVVDRKFNPPPPSPKDMDIWWDCWKLACQFWKEAFHHKIISKDYKMIAKENLETLKGLEEEAKMLPKKV